ncbi:hypothetical protein M409DRAFT_18366 [Zasmidium cellare ATCC 36951]|uniref:ABM domain-containing protein n=1 Tax=Zasmidium cellare ATCC 36951 TaxID=1080233 RepID=A0A6A6CVW2_ZASCE|nr:uncharacterized protein M409DRAFT_18366 [Zasmidium cellare ATCC 36951]KAF2171251.1 hypothetical protein M409DRAFT_18366 [Zasmidium cellare ATCC 36951]
MVSTNTSETILLAGYLTPHADKRARSVELWRAIADDIRSTEKGKISMELYEDQGREKWQEGFIVLEEFATQAIKDAFNAKPSHVAVSTQVREEGLISDFKIGYYKHVFGVGKTIGGHEREEKVLMAVFVTVNEGKTGEVLDLWKDIAEDVKRTEGGEVAMELYSMHEEVGGGGEEKGEKFFLVYEFVNEEARETFGKKPSHVEAIAKEREGEMLKNVDFKVCKRVLGSGSGIKAA